MINKTNWMHMILFFYALPAYIFLPWWAFLSAAIIFIEIDQAYHYAESHPELPIWERLLSRDTILDVIFGFSGMLAGYGLIKLIEVIL
jgi:hypothetical protein